MSDTTHLRLPYLDAAQAQKHVTVNEALARLDALVSLSVVSRSVSTPPASPSEGDRYIVASAATGDWAGADGQIAIFLNGGWDIVPPAIGWRAWIIDEGRDSFFDGLSWNDGCQAASGGAHMSVQVATEDFSLPAASSAQTSNLIPDRAVVIGVTARVIDAISGAPAWKLGVPGASGRYGTQIGPDLNSELNGVSGSPVGYYGDTPLLIEAESGAFAAGAIRLAVHYFKLTPPAFV